MASCSQTSPTRAFLLFVCGQGSRRHVPPRLASWTNSSRAIRSAVQCEVGVCPPTLKTCTPGTRESPRVLRLRSGASIFVHGFMACYTTAVASGAMPSGRVIARWSPTRQMSYTVSVARIRSLVYVRDLVVVDYLRSGSRVAGTVPVAPVEE